MPNYTRCKHITAVIYAIGNRYADHMSIQ
jgi:uncharacterized Zn finger protein